MEAVTFSADFHRQETIPLPCFPLGPVTLPWMKLTRCVLCTQTDCSTFIGERFELLPLNKEQELLREEGLLNEDRDLLNEEGELLNKDREPLNEEG